MILSMGFPLETFMCTLPFLALKEVNVLNTILYLVHYLGVGHKKVANMDTPPEPTR